MAELVYGRIISKASCDRRGISKVKGKETKIAHDSSIELSFLDLKSASLTISIFKDSCKTKTAILHPLEIPNNVVIL